MDCAANVRRETNKEARPAKRKVCFAERAWAIDGGIRWFSLAAPPGMPWLRGLFLKSRPLLPLILDVTMTLSESLLQVKRCAENMNARYGRVVFDEWAVVSLQRGRERIVSYQGPRKESFQKNFVSDLGSLRAEVLTAKHAPGHFDFARHATGTGFEAFICAGDELYVVCNNTQSTMDEIAKDARWLDAQKEFAALTDQFAANSLTV